MKQESKYYRRLKIFAICLHLSMSIGTANAQSNYSVTNLSLGGQSYVSDINESGQVVGGSGDSSGYYHAFLYDGTTMQKLSLGGNYSYANNINESGQVVGGSRDSSGYYHAFFYDGTTMQKLSLGGNYGNAFDINESGQVVGQSQDSSGESHAFLYDGTTMHNLNDFIDPSTGIVLHYAELISNSGHIVAQSNVGSVLLSASASAPTIGPITLDVDPVAINVHIIATANFMDEDTTDSHSGLWMWGDGSPDEDGVTSETGGTGNVTGTHAYTEAGIYTIGLEVTDSTGLSATVSREVVVYDPSAGFVTGGGWLWSPVGAYREDETLAGRANFGFVSKYKKGAKVPTGNTEFRFHAADLNFHSGNYDWLVVSGARAKYKGTGTINGQGEYKFMLTAVDSAIPGGGDADRFRIKIWEYDEENDVDVIIYDNQLDAGKEGTSDEGTAISGGSIVIHTKKK